MPEGQPKEVRYYDRFLFDKWISSIKDKNTRKIIYRRLQRIAEGNYGTHRNLKGGILELKFDSGIRIYGAEIGSIIVVILSCGGKSTKRDQDNDIATARINLAEFIEQLKQYPMENR